MDDENADDDEKPAPGIAELCPEVHSGIAASRLAPYLLPGWADWVPPKKLERYRDLLTEEPSASGPRPDTAAVAAIVKETESAQAAPKRTLWERFKDWLRSLVDKPDARRSDNWLSRWLDEHVPGEKLVDGILYVLLLALIAGIGWIVYTELRAAGLLERWRRRRDTRADDTTASMAPEPLTLAGASDVEAPSILLALLVGELHRLGRVQDRQSMTHRELGSAARFDAASEGEAFRGVLGAAERLRYDATPPAETWLKQVIAAGRALLERLARQTRSAT